MSQLENLPSREGSRKAALASSAARRADAAVAEARALRASFGDRCAL